MAARPSEHAASLGAALLDADNPSGAAEMFSAAVVAEEKLAAITPSDSNLKHDLALSHASVAVALMKIQRRAEAVEHILRGRMIIEDLLAQDPSSEQWKQDLIWFSSQIEASRR